MQRFILSFILVVVLSACSEANIPSSLHGTWVVDVTASEAYMTEHKKTGLIESLPFMSSTYKYVINNSEIMTLRKDAEIGRASISLAQASEGNFTLTVTGTNSQTGEDTEFQITFVAQPPNRYLIKLSTLPTNDYFVWKKQ